ncbi:AMP nucleosidase [Yersinia pestis]|uniref:AMP nucleosidase n=1 Tax=Yersinia pestis TaxID=632 RepID=UPI0039908D08
MNKLQDTGSLAVVEAIDKLEMLYDAALAALRDAISAFIRDGSLPNAAERSKGLFSYPQLSVRWDGKFSDHHRTRAYGRFSRAGQYSTTITRPALFREYLTEQMTLLESEYGAVFEVTPSQQEMPYPFVIDGSDLILDRSMTAGLAQHFPTTDLAKIGDGITDGIETIALGTASLGSAVSDLPLSHFDALRTDFSLARLKHYTGTPAEDIQPYILFTNYSRYVDEFVRWAGEQILDPNSPYKALSCAGGSIGVGPSNAKTICDHLAVLRPHVWLMIGHCGGLRESQSIGDYVLAHAYLRDDHVLDAVLPPDIPIPSIAEIQRALYDATKAVSGMPGVEVKQRLRTGTVVTSDDRNWELRFSASSLRFSLSRAVAVDMESATIAAQGYRFRVPYGTLLCVSDKPLHGEIKLPGQANHFYEGAISEHLQIGIRAIDLLRAEGDQLHSRKLRTFNEPPFR